jgi:DNA-binding NarL/FixJ family response regulator
MHGIAAGPPRRHDPLVGRDDELASLEEVLADLERGRSRAIELVGEPGIGKTRLLRELADRADLRGLLVLSGSASELERDLPFSAFVDALDEYVASLDLSELIGLDDSVQAELAHILPSLAALADGRAVARQHERYRSHRAMCALLERLADPRPLVLLLDDFHWADSASVELLCALLRRPPAAAVLTAFVLRPHQTPDHLSSALGRAHRATGLKRIELGPLTTAEARELLGKIVDAACADVLYRECEGNPLYLEQLARSLARTAGSTVAPGMSLSGLPVPPAVAASLAEELALLTEGARVMLAGAAVAGDPFVPELAAVAAATTEADAMDAVDELLQLDLIRATNVPRRFRFRHPLVRRAVYEATAGGWRLGAHERCAEELAAQGVKAAGRAHHVERSAREGDTKAVAVLREAGESAARLAPESAARWFAGALRLLPETAPPQDRVELLLARAAALGAVGHLDESHGALLEAVEIVPEESGVLRTAVATACAEVERLLGRYELAHERLVHLLCDLQEPASVESVGLLIELTLNEFYRARYDAMHLWAERATSAAKAIGDPALIAAALAMPALAHAMTGETETARRHRAKVAALVDGMSDDELTHRPDAAAWLASTELYLDLYAEADKHASRALKLDRATGRGDPFFRLYQILPRVWYVRGKLSESAELLDGAIEAGRVLGASPALAGNLFNRSVVAIAANDVETALAAAEEAAELTRGLKDGFVTAWAAVRLAGVLLEAGQGTRAVQVLLDRAGGEQLTLIPGSWKAFSLELLTRCWLELGRHEEAQRAAAYAEEFASALQLPLSTAWARRATGMVELARGNAAVAAEQAQASAAHADEVGAPIESALSRILAGRALAQAGRSRRAIAVLQRAAAELDACGALRYRDQAERELGKLGHRTHRRTRPGNVNGTGIETLTSRELQVAQLVADRKTNPQIATELFLSQKTVETHLRNIFRKVDLTSRVELARAVDQAARNQGAESGLRPDVGAAVP